VAGVGLGLIVRETGGDYILGRNLIAAWMPLWALAAAGLAFLPRRWMTAAGAGVLCALFLAITMVDLTDDRQQRPNWQGVAEAIGPAPSYSVIVGPAQLASRPLAHY